MDTPKREEGVDYIVCGKTPFVEDSRALECTTCGRQVFCSPTGRDLMVENRLAPICVDCVDIRQDDTIVPPTPAQMEEMKRYGFTEEQIKTALWNLQLPREERL